MKQRNVVIFIDEAHLLSADTFENLRLLTNLESDGNKLIQIVLAGQPALISKLRRPDLRHFNQRVARILSIDPLNQIQTYRYIQHRLRIAGHRGPPVFDTRALKLIWRYSEGVPRLINKICENALLVNYMSGGKIVPAGVIRKWPKSFTLIEAGSAGRSGDRWCWNGSKPPNPHHA